MSNRQTIGGVVRSLLAGMDRLFPAAESEVGLSEQQELLVALGSSIGEETVKVGRSYKAGITAAVAAVVAIPTTAHMYAIFNNEPDGGRSYVIDRIWAQNVVTTAVACQAQLLCLIGQTREAIPTDATPVNTLVKLNGMASSSSNKIDSRVISILTATALPATTGLAGYWIPVGACANKPGVATTPGYGLEALINGRYIVPPGRYFAVHVLANVVGETFVAGVEWHEKTISLG